MEFQDVVRRRRMVRAFDPDRPVTPEQVQRMLANAVRAPNAGFSQGWAFLVLDTPEQRDRFWTATDITEDEESESGWLRGMRTAPLIVVPLSSKAAYLERYAQGDKGWSDRDEARWPVPYWDVDTGMAALLILQTVVDEGLGACLFGVPPERTDAFATAFGVPETHRAIGAVAIGHPAPGGVPGSPSRRARTPLADLVHHGRWGG